MRSDTRLDVAGYLRQARRRTRMSQRELAAACGVSASTLSRAEAGRTELSLLLFTRLLRAAGLRLVVVDDEPRRVPALAEPPDTRDLAERRFSAHLDLILDPVRGEWWGDRFGLVRPPETFHRDPAARYAHRLVFHELRGLLVHGEPTDWRGRVERDKSRFAKEDSRRRARYSPDEIPGRRAATRPRRRRPRPDPPGLYGYGPYPYPLRD
ncbi:MAG: helix-turn-helix transcriptional regulator [Mycobacteriaceae bacterium]